ncbi:hypothetical protein BsWGS_09842 [Bradybaena similaris]
MADDEQQVRDVFVAVHAGAGNHSMSNEHLYKSVCSLACHQAMTLLKSRRSALEAVTAAVAVLENDECTNAGRGSNLTMQGTVECDASAMDGQSLLFGAVGALSGVANPVNVARRLIEEQKLGSLSCGRVRPSILVGKGAQTFCCEKGIDVLTNLISATSLKTYIRYKRRCLNAESDSTLQKRRKVDTPEVKSSGGSRQQLPHTSASAGDDSVQDTVGAVCVDHLGNVAAATSSGGIWLKHSGRLGPAAIYGAGCWAQNQISESKPGVAAVTSGCGEDLIQTVLAKTCSDAIRSSSDLSQSLAKCFSVDFLGSEFLASKMERFGGVLILRTNKSSPSKEGNLCFCDNYLPSLSALSV